MSAQFLIAQFSLAFAAAIFVVAAISDFRTYTIPNRLVLGLLFLYPAYVFSTPGAVDWTVLGYGLALAVAVFAAGAALFRMGAMGGGDVKLLAVTALWAGPALTLPMLLVTVTAGVAVAMFVAARAQFAAAPSMTAALIEFQIAPLLKLSVPYGVAISAGGLFVIARLILA